MNYLYYLTDIVVIPSDKYAEDFVIIILYQQLTTAL
jgi:hypothetical protein